MLSRHVLHFLAMFAAVGGYAGTDTAAAKTISGTYNTGVSDVDADDNSSLDIRFHPCKEDAALTCGTIVRAIEPDGPSGDDTLPDGSAVIGFQMIVGLEDRGDEEYRKGKINAIDESLEKKKMIWYGLKVDDNLDGTLTAKGCLAFICPRTMLWTEVAGEGADSSR